MAFSRAANVVEHVADRSDNADITTNVSNYAKGSAGEETDARIKATTWQGKGSVKLGVLRSRLPSGTRTDDCNWQSRYPSRGLSMQGMSL